MRLLLDTHILVWLAGEREKLSERERAAIIGSDEVLVSVLSLIELRVKTRAERRRGQPPSVMSPDAAIAFCATRDIAICPLIATDLTAVLATDPPHADPFDELLLAHAQALGARLLTRDEDMAGYPLAYRP